MSIQIVYPFLNWVVFLFNCRNSLFWMLNRNQIRNLEIFSLILEHVFSLSCWSAVVHSWLTASSASWVQAILLPQPS